jgi:hypothetical protein
MEAEEAAFETAFQADPIAAGSVLDLTNISVCGTMPSKQLAAAISLKAIRLSFAGSEALAHAQSMMFIRLSGPERVRHCAWSARMIEKALSLLNDKGPKGQD